jgi:ABC-type enterochelin transport system permease subunit
VKARPVIEASNPYGTSLSLALSGAVFGCLGVGIVSGFLGVWPLFFAFPPFTVFLVLSALAAAFATAMLARLCRHPLSTPAIMALSAVLTFVLFAAMPLYFVLFVPARADGLPF